MVLVRLLAAQMMGAVLLSNVTNSVGVEPFPVQDTFRRISGQSHGNKIFRPVLGVSTVLVMR